MDILTITKKAQETAADYVSLPLDQRPDSATAVRESYAQRVADWRGFGLTDVPFRQFELVFGLEVTRLGGNQ